MTVQVRHYVHATTTMSALCPCIELHPTCECLLMHWPFLLCCYHLGLWHSMSEGSLAAALHLDTITCSILNLYSLIASSDLSEVCILSCVQHIGQSTFLFTDVAASQLMMAVQAASAREDHSPTGKSQPAGAVSRAQDLAVDLAKRSSDAAPSAAPVQVCFAFSHGTAKRHVCCAKRDTDIGVQGLFPQPLHADACSSWSCSARSWSCMIHS